MVVFVYHTWWERIIQIDEGWAPLATEESVHTQQCSVLGHSSLDSVGTAQATGVSGLSGVKVVRTGERWEETFRFWMYLKTELVIQLCVRKRWADDDPKIFVLSSYWNRLIISINTGLSEEQMWGRWLAEIGRRFIYSTGFFECTWT